MSNDASQAESKGDGISAALAANDERTLSRLLQDAKLAVLLQDGESRDPQVLIDEDDLRCLVTFSSPATYARWDGRQQLGMISGSDVAALALTLGAHVVLIDPAGPAPVRFEPQYLQEILDGIAHDVDGGQQLSSATLQFRTVGLDRFISARNALLNVQSVGLELFFVDRREGDRWLPTLCAYGPDLAVAAFAHELMASDATAQLGTVDVLPLVSEVRAYLLRSLPQSRLST